MWGAHSLSGRSAWPELEVKGSTHWAFLLSFKQPFVNLRLVHAVGAGELLCVELLLIAEPPENRELIPD